MKIILSIFVAYFRCITLIAWIVTINMKSRDICEGYKFILCNIFIYALINIFAVIYKLTYSLYYYQWIRYVQSFKNEFKTILNLHDNSDFDDISKRAKEEEYLLMVFQRYFFDIKLHKMYYHIPKQPTGNGYDCGVFVLKYLEIIWKAWTETDEQTEFAIKFTSYFHTKSFHPIDDILKFRKLIQTLVKEAKPRRSDI